MGVTIGHQMSQFFHKVDKKETSADDYNAKREVHVDVVLLCIPLPSFMDFRQQMKETLKLNKRKCVKTFARHLLQLPRRRLVESVLLTVPINTPPPKHKIPERAVRVKDDMTSPVDDIVKPSFFIIILGNKPRTIETNPRTDIVKNFASSKFILLSYDD